MEDVRSVLVAHGNASECVWVNSNAEPSGFSPSHGVGPPENYAQLLKCTGGFQGLSYWSVTATRRANVVGAVSCPAWVDFSNPALSGPAGAAPGLDGKCRTGRYDPISAQAAAALFDQYAPKTQAPTVVQDALGSGIDAQPYVSDEPGVASGPVTVTGAPTTTTTTGPTGAPTTTTSTPTQNVSYTNNQYTYNTTVVTVTNNNGDVTTTTTMQGEPAPEGKTDCDKYPDSIGCSKYGDPPSDAPIWKTQTIVYSEDALGLPSGCPPDRHFNFRGIDLQLRYQVLCDVAPTIKLALLALAALSCMFIVMQALKQ